MIRFCLLLALLLAGVGVQAHAQDACDFRLDRTKQFEATFKQLLLDEAEQAKGLWQPIRRAQKEVQELARFVGRLDVCLRTPDGRQVEYLDPVGGFRVKSDKFVGLCTATLLPGNQLITARHCYHDDRVAALGFTEIEAVKVHFDFRQADFIGDVQSFDVSPVEVASVTDVDAMILKVKGDANGAMGGHIPLIFQTRTQPQDALLMIHHPIAQPTQFSSGTCAVASEQSDLPDHAPNLRHMCETFGGSSGALILDADKRVVVGLHQGADVVKDSFGRVRDGFNIGFKFEPVNEALDLGFAPLSAVERTLQGVPALQGLAPKREVLTDILTRYPGTMIAARANGMLKALPERDVEAEARAALIEAREIADVVARRGRLGEIVAQFPETDAAANARFMLDLLDAPADPVADATGALAAAERVEYPKYRRTRLEEVKAKFAGTPEAERAQTLLNQLQDQGKTHAKIIERGRVNCAVSEGVDDAFCYVLAGHLFGEYQFKVKRFDVGPMNGLSHLHKGTAEVLVSTEDLLSNWSTDRKYRKVGSVVRGNMAILLPKTLGIQSVSELNEATGKKYPNFCHDLAIEAPVLKEFLRNQKVSYELLWPFVTEEDVQIAYLEGRCDAVVTLSGWQEPYLFLPPDADPLQITDWVPFDDWFQVYVMADDEKWVETVEKIVDRLDPF